MHVISAEEIPSLMILYNSLYLCSTELTRDYFIHDEII